MPGVVAENADGPSLRLDVGDQRIDRRLARDVEHRAAAAAARSSASLIRAAPSGRGGGADDPRPVGARARCAMAAPMPRDAPVTKAISPFSMSLQDSVRSASASSRDCGSSSASILRSRFLSTRRLSAVSTLPGPHSTMWVAPAAIMVRTVAAQYTGVCSCLTKAGANIRPGVVMRFDVDAVDRECRPQPRHRDAPRAARAAARPPAA